MHAVTNSGNLKVTPLFFWMEWSKMGIGAWVMGR